jgi:phosphatidylethanolamine-binding protein (PEBP) family uncharacterized protein
MPTSRRARSRAGFAWNILPDVSGLREGLAPDMLLREPQGLVQRRNTRFNIGYFGLKPPPGDGAHRYHFQLFAFDATLDLKPGSSATI